MNEAAATAAPPRGVTSDISATPRHAPITWQLIRTVEHDAELKALLAQSIAQAAAINPDRQTNPVDSLEAYYDFIDWSIRAMPWEISPQRDYISLYDRIDQSMGCFYFAVSQPLEQLAGRGYYHNSLIYHEPFRSWLVQFTAEYGQFLDAPGSWSDEYLQNALRWPEFHIADGTYESPDNWRCFNDFFSRRLRDPALRPIDAPDDPRVIVSPADALPQGVWRISAENRVLANAPVDGAADAAASAVARDAGLAVKTATLRDVSDLLGPSEYARAFAGGTLTHTMLDVFDYHRFHCPVDGVVREVYALPAGDIPGGVIYWDAAANRYKSDYFEGYGWQSIETRAVAVIDSPLLGPVAVVPVGMCEVASVNFEPHIAPGARVRKGDPLGWFLFGGSDIIMLFGAGVELADVAEGHILMGQSDATARL